MAIARHRDFDCRRAEEHRRKLVDDEGLGTEDHLVTGTQESLREHDHHLVRTIADDEITRLQRPLLRQFLAQEGATAIGIQVTLIERLAGGGQPQRRRAQRVLIGSELNDSRGIQAELAGDDLDGTASLIDGLIEYGPIG